MVTPKRRHALGIGGKQWGQSSAITPKSGTTVNNTKAIKLYCHSFVTSVIDKAQRLRQMGSYEQTRGCGRSSATKISVLLGMIGRRCAPRPSNSASGEARPSLCGGLILNPERVHDFYDGGCRLPTDSRAGRKGPAAGRGTSVTLGRLQHIFVAIAC